MIKYTFIESDDANPTDFTRDDIAAFLFDHLDQYGDEREDILSCIAYAFGDREGQGGIILLAHEEGTIVGAVIINDTNMGGYIPEHILVYIAVHGDYRGRGIGKNLMERIIERTEGDIALHVEPDNPAKFLYEKYDFTNKYLEMRFKR